MAFITGIYEELIDSIRKVGPAAACVLWQQGLRAFWQHINGSFLLTVFAGILFSLGSLAQVISHVLENHPILIWAFFFGLVLASTLIMLRHLPGWKLSFLGFFLLGSLLAFLVTELRPTALPNAWWVLMASGAVAICAMILPGISGSFILLLIGVYGYFIQAIQSFEVVTLASFLVGCVVGLLLFSHLLSWLLHHFHDLTVALLTGFLLGSLNVIWPWKLVVESTVNRHGELVPLVQENVLPAVFALQTGQAAQTLPAIGCALAGFTLVLLIEYIARVAGTSEEVQL